MAEFLRRGRPLGLAKAPSSRARSSPTCAATWPCWTPKRSIWGQLPQFRVGRLPSGRTASAPRHGHRPVQQARRPGRGQADSIARREAHLRHDRSFDAGVDPKIVADRIGHANTAYTLAIYTHKSTGKDRCAAETVAGVLLGTGWTCTKCKAVYIGTPPKSGQCPACEVS